MLFYFSYFGFNRGSDGHISSYRLGILPILADRPHSRGYVYDFLLWALVKGIANQPEIGLVNPSGERSIRINDVSWGRRGVAGLISRVSDSYSIVDTFTGYTFNTPSAFSKDASDNSLSPVYMPPSEDGWATPLCDSSSRVAHLDSYGYIHWLERDPTPVYVDSHLSVSSSDWSIDAVDIVGLTPEYAGIGLTSAGEDALTYSRFNIEDGVFAIPDKHSLLNLDTTTETGIVSLPERVFSLCAVTRNKAKLVGASYPVALVVNFAFSRPQEPICGWFRTALRYDATNSTPSFKLTSLDSIKYVQTVPQQDFGNSSISANEIEFSLSYTEQIKGILSLRGNYIDVDLRSVDRDKLTDFVLNIQTIQNNCDNTTPSRDLNLVNPLSLLYGESELGNPPEKYACTDISVKHAGKSSDIRKETINVIASYPTHVGLTLEMGIQDRYEYHFSGDIRRLAMSIYLPPEEDSYNNIDESRDLILSGIVKEYVSIIPFGAVGFKSQITTPLVILYSFTTQGCSSWARDITLNFSGGKVDTFLLHQPVLRGSNLRNTKVDPGVVALTLPETDTLLAQPVLFFFYTFVDVTRCKNIQTIEYTPEDRRYSQALTFSTDFSIIFCRPDQVALLTKLYNDWSDFYSHAKKFPVRLQVSHRDGSSHYIRLDK